MTSHTLNFDGIFEIHIIVDPKQEPQLYAFTMDEYVKSKKEFKNVKPTRALSFYGNKYDQPMLSCFVTCDSNTAVKHANDLAEQMRKNSMNVGRVKVEAMAKCKEIMEMGVTDINKNNYFEFHFKVPIESKKEWNRLAEVCLPFGSHLFFNPYSKSEGYMQPVVTLRRYDMDYKTAFADCTTLMQTIQKAGFNVSEHTKVQHEFSILDTDVTYDENWLFRGDPRNFIRDKN